MIEENEMLDPKEILNILTDACSTKVATPFSPAMTLQSFLEKYDVTLPTLDEDEFSYMDAPFTADEVSQKSKCAWPDRTKHCHVQLYISNGTRHFHFCIK